MSRWEDHGTAWLLAHKQHQSVSHPFILVTCGHMMMKQTVYSHITDHCKPWATSIHMLVSEPVGHKLCFLPVAEGDQTGVYMDLCLWAFSLLQIEKNLTLCVHNSNIYFTAVFKDLRNRESRRNSCCSLQHFQLYADKICFWKNLFLPNWIRNLQRQVQGHRFNCICWGNKSIQVTLLSSATELGPQRAGQIWNKTISVQFYSCQSC